MTASRKPPQSITDKDLAGLSKAERRILALLQEQQKPLTWPALRDRLGAHRGSQADDLRRQLRDLCRHGSLYLDEGGAYHLVSGAQALRGKLVAATQGRGLALHNAADGQVWPVRHAPREQLRIGDEVAARLLAGQAMVTQVLAYSAEPVVGRLCADPKGWYLVSESPDFRGRIYLPKRKAGGIRDGDSLSVRITGSAAFGLTGEIVAKLAARDDLHVASSTLLMAYRVPLGFSQAAEAEVAALPTAVDRRQAKGRKDLTAMPLVTIDGVDARDFDDAVYCEKRRFGGWRLLVAIADVAHYVQAGSALDTDAAERGNSVYLPDRVVPMLPEAISNELCSLKPQVDRLCMVCDMRISGQGRITKFEFYEGLMHSAQRLTYDQVAAFLAGTSKALSLPDKVSKSVRALHDLYQVLRAERDHRGALDFDTQEMRLVLENGLVERIEPVQRNDAHMLIEEAMISANICAARYLEKHRRQGLYRIHEGPTGDKLENLRQALAQVGIRLAGTQPTPKELQQIMRSLSVREDRWLYDMLVLRSLSQASYHPVNCGHYGLALPKYMHFTSPIRRYADLLVHRAIKDVLHGRPLKDQMPKLLAVGEHISYTDRRAEEVSRAVADWLKCEYAARFLGEQRQGRITGVTDFGLFVELEEIHVSGLVHISNLGDDYYQFNPATMSLVGDRTGQGFRLGEQIQVVIAAVDPESRKIDLLLAPTRQARSPGQRRSRRRSGADKAKGRGRQDGPA